MALSQSDMQDRFKSEESRKRFEIEDVADVVKKTSLWLGHLEREDAGERVSACRDMTVVGNAGRGRLKKRWNFIY